MQNNIETTERLIYIDDLTGLFNRRYLYYQLPKDLQAAKGANYNIWLFMLDIDDFKLLNDSYGHLFGDEVIKGVGNILRGNLKTDDKKIRYAGDEFTIIFSRLEAKSVADVAQRLLVKINSHPFREKRSGRECYITTSIGIAGYPQDTPEPIELINLADRALYISKRKGKKCVSFASEITPELFWKKDILERFPCSILVGREEEFLRFKEALNKIKELPVKLLLFSGELGVGKSRLLNEFERFISQEKLICLCAKCEEKYLSQPYYILGQALYRYLLGLDKLPLEILQGISESQVSALFSFMPIMKDLFPGLSIKEELTPQDKDCLSEGLIKFLFNLSNVNPLYFLFDDFHCVDSQSLEVILRLIRENKELPILVIATFSPDEIASPELQGAVFVSKIKEEAFVTYSESITLSRLSPQATKEMISRILAGIPLFGEFSDLIYKITQGNPLFIEELLKYIIEKEYIFYQDSKWTQRDITEAELPSTIEETIRARVKDLNPEIREMVAKAAVIGDDFQIDILQRIDSEDRGYVLDIIEAAKKVGLIYESGTLGKDEYSFVTGQMRQVLFKIIGDNRKKDLYSRLGEIKERLSQDKLSSVASELYYNFKKAQDLVRAEQYAKLAKEGKTTFYDQTVRYAEALLEKAEEVTVPLSKSVWMIVPEIIRYMYISTVNYILYPAQSQMRQESTEELYKRLSQVLSEVNLLNIACVENTIIVNNRKIGKELKGFFSEAVISLLKNLDVESIAFKKELKLQELSVFIEVISRTEEKEEGLSELLNRAGVTNIQINEITYDILKRKAKEKERLEEIMLIDYLLGKLPSFEDKKVDFSTTIATHAEEISQALEKLGEQASKRYGKDKETAKAEIMAKSIQKMGSQLLEKGPDDWIKYKKGLAKTILSMEPTLQANIFAAGIEEQDIPQGKFDIIRELSLEIPDETIIDVLSRQYLQKDTDLGKMKRLVQRFLSTPVKKEKLTPLLKEKFKQIGATEDECNWLFLDKGWEKFSLEEKVDKILTLPTKTFLKVLPIMRIEAVIKELSSLQQEMKVEAVLERLLKPLEEKFPGSQVLVGYLREVLGIFIQDSPDKLLPKFINRLLKMVSFNKKELSTAFFSILTPYLEKVIEIFLNAEYLVLSKEIIKTYTDDERTMQGLSKIFEPITAKLIEELIRRIDMNIDWMQLAEILILLRNYSAKPLIEEALFEKGVPQGEYFEAYLRRFTLACILKQLPKESFLNIIKEKFSDSRLFIVKNLIELIRAMEDDQLIHTLEIPLKRPEVAIRKKVLFTLGKIRGKESSRLLDEALKDEDVNIRKEALGILKNRNDTFSLEILKNYKSIQT